MGYLHSYIENDDIENPVQTIFKPRTYYRLAHDRTIIKKFRFQKHQFRDNTSMFQLFGGNSVTEFINLQDIEETEWPYGSHNNIMLNFKFSLGEKFIIHTRKVYDSMNLLEDAGGVVQSMMFIGIVLHFLIVNNEEP